ncbi:MAG: hypothetical protein K0Q72_3786 [Armatimonadetes bacterium]|jgi:hypothetical protein|nr:hypothetical protein [Armatimonadota bacterium]
MTRPLTIATYLSGVGLVAALGSQAATAPAKPAAAKPAAGKVQTRELLADVVTLEPARVVVKEIASGKQLTFPGAKSEQLWRFGEPGAAWDEFKPGERVLLRTETPPKGPARVTQLSDAISEQVRLKQSYRMVSQDRDNYRFTVEPLDAVGEPAGQPLTLEYGRPTFLVLRENPEYVFRVGMGALLWVNLGVGPDGKTLVAREVLDEASRVRFGKQQHLRMLARKTPPGQAVSYDRDVRPILEVNCLPCHGNGRAQSGFTITDLPRMFAGGPRGKGVVPGKSAESLLYLTMTGERNPRMAPDRDAIPEQLDLIKRWIDAGAVIDKGTP